MRKILLCTLLLAVIILPACTGKPVTKIVMQTQTVTETQTVTSSSPATTILQPPITITTSAPTITVTVPISPTTVTQTVPTTVTQTQTQTKTVTEIVSISIESYVDGTFEGWDGDTIFLLTNGQIWQQASYSYTYHYAYRPWVVIYPTSGGYKMMVEGVDKTIYVRRLA